MIRRVCETRRGSDAPADYLVLTTLWDQVQGWMERRLKQAHANDVSPGEAARQALEVLGRAKQV